MPAKKQPDIKVGDKCGRGITYCERLETFEGFIATLGNAPSPQHSIDRIEVDGNYSCGECEQCRFMGWTNNVRWATPVEQGNNRSNNNRLSLDGEIHTVAEWARLKGINLSTLSSRLHKRKWTIEQALRTPVKSA